MNAAVFISSTFIAFMVIGAVAYPSMSWDVIYRLENALRLFISMLAYSFN